MNLFLCVVFLGCNRTLIVCEVILAVGLSGLTLSGIHVNHLDLAP